MEQAASLVSSLLKRAEKPSIIITTHHKPDADALGSSLGLHLFLKSLGIPSQVITPTDYPQFLFWMPGHKDVMIYEGNEVNCKALISKADMIFCLDFNNLDRINEMGADVRASEAEKVLIDHHQAPEGFETYRFWDTTASSTCELIYRFIVDSGHKASLDENIAACLYCGIMTDTGSFKFSNCSAETHRIAASLMEYGFDHVAIHDRIFDSFTENRIRFIGYALSRKLEVLWEYNTALITIDKDELEQFSIRTGDTEGLVNYGLGIEGIKFAALIIDRSKMVKMSFRSKGQFRANEFARDHFNGGGHINAAGGSSTDTLENAVAKFKTVLNDYKTALTE